MKNLAPLLITGALSMVGLVVLFFLLLTRWTP
jgi:hypothetical protein